jgi:hypothetical protein
MRTAVYLFALAGTFALSSCAPERQSLENSNVTNRQPSAVSSEASAPTQPQTSTAATNSDMPLASGHGATAVPMQAAPQSALEGKVDTSAYDARIKKAEARADAKGASEADRRAAAAAYLERGNLFYTAQQPSLYKFALGDFRKVVKYQPDNEEARAKIEQLIEIYKQLNRPVPTNGLEP